MKIFGTDRQKETLKLEKKLNSGTKRSILKKASKLCNIENIDRGKYIFTEIYKHARTENISDHPLYHTLSSMKYRCYNPNSQGYQDYGGRGIAVCDEWLNKENGIDEFIRWAEKNGYEPNKGLSIDRIDNDGNYEPDNCRWVTKDVQLKNRRSFTRKGKREESRIEEFNGYYLTSLYFDGKIYPVGTFNTREKAESEKGKLRTLLVNDYIEDN